MMMRWMWIYALLLLLLRDLSFFFFQRVELAGFKRGKGRERDPNLLIRLVGHKFVILIVHGKVVVGKRRCLWWGRRADRVDHVRERTVPVCEFRIGLHGRHNSKHVHYVINPRP
jgi:hypothetical protein